MPLETVALWLSAINPAGLDVSPPLERLGQLASARNRQLLEVLQAREGLDQLSARSQQPRDLLLSWEKDLVRLVCQGTPIPAGHLEDDAHNLRA
jgi:hypothetical protein